jgi:hypothetical protein
MAGDLAFRFFPVQMSTRFFGPTRKLKKALAPYGPQNDDREGE